MSEQSELDKIWDCTVIIQNKELPNGADSPPRKAVVEAIENMGLSILSVSSGWGAEEFTPKIASLKRRIADLESEYVSKSYLLEQNEKLLEELEVVKRERDELKSEINSLNQNLADANANLVQWNGLMMESEGVFGYHLNGDIASWEEFDFTQESPLVAADNYLNKRDLEKMALGIQSSIDFYKKNNADSMKGQINYGVVGKVKVNNPDAIPIEILERDIKALVQQAKEYDK